MAARRIFEIPASGACLVSGPGLAVREVFGNTVPMVYSSEQATATLDALMADEAFLRYTIQTSRHIVLKRHLNNHRLQKMLNASSLTLQRPSSVADTVIVSDTSTSIRDICLWFARQELEFTHLVLPSAPATKAEELLVNLLRNRGLSVSYEQPEASNSPTIHIHKILAFDHHGLDALFSEMHSTPHTVHYKSPSGELLATCKQPTSEIEFTLEYHVPTLPPEKLISTITDHTFAEVPSTILIAGHDLKFAMPIVEVLEEMGIRVLVDKWDNHNKFDAEQSRVLFWRRLMQCGVNGHSGMSSGIPMLLSQACPYLSGTIFKIRELEYLNSARQENITHVSFVCDYYRKHSFDIGQLSRNVPSSVIPNLLQRKDTSKKRNDNFSIGFVGMVPKRKRLDLVIDLLEDLQKKDPRYQLKIVGKHPDEYAWLQNREDEKQYYESIKTRLSQNPILASKIEFLGFVDDISEFYSSVGHVISTSDFESFHLTLADGPSLGCAAHTLKWDGSETIYSDLWLNNDVKSMAKRIHELKLCNQTSYHAHQQLVHLYPQMQTERIALSIIEAISGGGSNA